MDRNKAASSRINKKANKTRPTAIIAAIDESQAITSTTQNKNELRLTLTFLHHGGRGKFAHEDFEQGWFIYDAMFIELGDKKWVIEIKDTDIKKIRDAQWPHGIGRGIPNKKKSDPPNAVQVILVNQGSEKPMRVKSLNPIEALAYIAEAEISEGGKIDG